MLKFFRRIRFDLMEKNKTGKYFKYAIGEIVLVVIGILIALSINTWNQNQINIRKEIHALKGLKGDLINLVERLEQWEEFNRTGERLVMKILNYNGVNINKPAMDSVFSSMLFVNVLDKGGGPLEAMISTGKLELIRDHNIREKLSKWPDMLEDIHTNDLSVRDLVWREIIPYLAEYGIPEFYCEKPEIYCTIDEPISNAYLNILKDNKFKALMNIRLTGFRTIALDYGSKAFQAREILNLINNYLTNETKE